MTSFHTRHTAHCSKTELVVIYGFMVAFVVCIIGYIAHFGGIW